jgi:hypothetical protein
MKEESKRARKPKIERRTEKKTEGGAYKRGMLGFIPPRILTRDKPTNFETQKAINDKLYVVVFEIVCRLIVSTKVLSSKLWCCYSSSFELSFYLRQQGILQSHKASLKRLP